MVSHLGHLYANLIRSRDGTLFGCSVVRLFVCLLALGSCYAVHINELLILLAGYPFRGNHQCVRYL